MLVLPIRDAIPSRTVPIVTLALIGLNSIAFLLEQTLDAWQWRALLLTYGLVPAAFDPRAVITSMFLHATWPHFLGNMLFLWIFAENVEDRMGHGRFLLFFLACGAAAALGQTVAWRHSGMPMVGASGAIAGVLGAHFILFPSSRILTLVWLIVHVELVEVPALFFLGVWLFLQLLFEVGSLSGAGGGMAFWAHASGFAAGMALALILRRPERMGIEWVE